jgi:EAL domain-containing protein (putative c-di-GMP-specific phosphodiesterase class I)
MADPVVRGASMTQRYETVHRGDFYLEYQPIMSLPSGRIAGFEALLRWRRPPGEEVPPEEFIPLAEETGLIVPLGLWVLEEACRQMRAWQGVFPGCQSMYMSVNLSGRQLNEPSLVRDVTYILAQTGLAPCCLHLELTESVGLEEGGALAALEALHNEGIYLALDDFGTGYSCLRYLHALPVSIVKIDRSFVRHIGGDRRLSRLCKAIIDLAHAVDVQVTAEGIETEEQRTLLCAWGCDQAQGFLWGPPMGPEAVVSFLRAGLNTDSSKCYRDDLSRSSQL